MNSPHTAFFTRRLAFVFIITASISVAPGISTAAVRTVTTLTDGGAGSLRQVIAVSLNNDVIDFSVTGTMTLTNQLVIAKTLSITGPGATNLTISGQNSNRVFSIAAANTVLIQGLTITNGRTTEFAGGGVANAGTLRLLGCIIVGNNSQNHAGGVYNTGTLTVESCTVSNNSSGIVGGGLYNKNGNMTVTNSTIFANSCGLQGGGIASENTNLTVINCTISANRSVTHAGGVLVFGNAYFNHTTIAFNHAPSGAGVYNAGRFRYENCILGLNRGGVNLINATNGTISLGNNLSSDNTGNLTQPSDLVGVEPKLRPLGAHGGLNLIHALDPISPAINAGNATGPSLDQRGALRPSNGIADIGAFESPVPILVTNSADSGAGSLRAAITMANAGVGTHIIRFSPPGAVKQITLLTPLPAINDTVMIDHGVLNGLPPSIVLNGAVSGIDVGLRINTHDSMVRGLAFIGFADSAIVFDGNSYRNQIMQCYVGIDRNEQAVANQTGITLEGSATANVIGTDGDGSDDALELNVISGNFYGIFFNGAQQNRVSGNRIGTDRAGMAAIPNDFTIFVAGPASGNIIGTDGNGDGFDAGERNIISGNNGPGVLLAGTNKVAGNYIGVDATGTNALPNQFGIQYGGSGGVVGTDNPLVGDPMERNIISGNLLGGIIMGGAGTFGVRVSGNFIGTDKNGIYAVPNETGIEINSHGHNILLGGAGPGLGNVISGNSQNAIQIVSGAYSNRVEGNAIGVSSGFLLPNGGHGIMVSAQDETNNVIGGVLPGAGNIIAYNGLDGVHIASTMGGSVVGNAILGNSIYNNDGLGIDLAPDHMPGVTLNDGGDADTGPNTLQNFPVLTSVASDGVNTYVTGTLESGSANFHLEFFVDANPDPSGFGEGHTFLGSAAMLIASGSGPAGFVATLPFPSVVGNTVTATATVPGRGTSEFSQGLAVTDFDPPQISTGPGSTNINVGQSLTLCVAATGTQPISYQWRLNGVNIPGATNACYTIASISLESGGSYTVVAANPGGAVTSQPALVQVNFAVTPAGDNLAQAVSFGSNNGAIRASNVGATSELGEPKHAGKSGGKSVWYRWTPVSSGIATVRTLGSAFDTLLAVYERTNPVVNVTNLIAVVSDEDGAGFLTSETRFNAVAGKTYWIAVDGFGGANGNFTISWSLEVTADTLPVITVFPVGATVAPGTNYTFQVTAAGVGLTYQWFHNGSSITNATNSSYAVSIVNTQTVGTYVVRIRRAARFVDTPPVSLQINLTGAEVQTVAFLDKLQDAVSSTPLRLGQSGEGGGRSGENLGTGGASLARGYTGTQVFNTRGAASQPDEPNHCNVPGGASLWFTYLAEHEGVIFLNTDGSDFDTVLAVYSGTLVNGFSSLIGEACDNNSGADGRDSALRVRVHPGTTYYIAVDGVNAASGPLILNYSLVIPATFQVLGLNSQGIYGVRITGRPAMKLLLEASEDFSFWFPLLTTNSVSGVVEYNDPASAGLRQRVYRALMFP